MGSKKHLSLIDAYVFESAKKSTDKVLKKGIDKQATGEVLKESTQETESDPKVINRSSDQVDNRSSGQLTNQLTDQLISQVDNRSTNQVINRSSDQVDNRSTNQVINRSSDQVKEPRPEKKPPNLTDRQLSVLKIIYHNRPFKIHGPNGIGAMLGIGAPNVRNQIKSLVNKGYINKPYSINDGVNVGSTCRIVEEKCKPLFGDTPIVNPPEKKSDSLKNRVVESSQVINRSSDQLINQSSDQIDNQSSDQVINSYSSSSLSKETTTKINFLSESEAVLSEIMNSDPEYKFWIDENVSPKQVAKWVFEFGTDLKTMLNHLCYIRWEIVVQGIKIQKSAAAYIYMIMKKNGGTVNKPAGYKSLKQLNIEALEKWRDEQIKFIEKQDVIKQEVAQAKFGPQADKLLSKPSLENQLIVNALERVATAKKRNAIEIAIKNGKALDEIHKRILRGHIINEMSEKETE